MAQARASIAIDFLTEEDSAEKADYNHGSCHSDKFV